MCCKLQPTKGTHFKKLSKPYDYSIILWHSSLSDSVWSGVGDGLVVIGIDFILVFISTHPVNMKCISGSGDTI